MYRHQHPNQLKMDIPFGVELDADNYWVRVSKLIPWEQIDTEYRKNFEGNEGQLAKSSRLAFGALFIQKHEGFTDEQTRRNIQENPYLQYFCGFECYTMLSPFDQSMMTHFRKRISAEMVQKINEIAFKDEVMKTIENASDTGNVKAAAKGDQMAGGALESDKQKCDTVKEEVAANEKQCQKEKVSQAGGMREKEETKALPESVTSACNTVTEEVTAKQENEQEQSQGADVSQAVPPKNRGTLILDGTCIPADIHFPTDINLLNKAREIAEIIIDILYDSNRWLFENKPRTYRESARKEYVIYSKKRRHTSKEIRQCIHRSLLYLKRDLGHIEAMIQKGCKLTELPKDVYRKLLVIQEIHRQQWEMYNNKTNQISDRIVSISQPHVRPIVRGKAGSPTEFGAKAVVGLVGGYAFVITASWDNISEAKQLIKAAEEYRRIFGFYPERILGDRAYPTNENRAWCKAKGIRLSGPRKGRKSPEETLEESKMLYQDGCDRIPIEGTFGVCKRRYDLDRISTKLTNTSMTSICMGFFVANMERKLRLFFLSFYYCFLQFYLLLPNRLYYFVHYTYLFRVIQ